MRRWLPGDRGSGVVEHALLLAVLAAVTLALASLARDAVTDWVLPLSVVG